MPEVEGLSEEEEVKVVEKDLQHLEMELAATRISLHPQKLMQVVEGFFLEEEEAEAEEEKSDVTDVTSWDTKLLSAQRMQT